MSKACVLALLYLPSRDHEYRNSNRFVNRIAPSNVARSFELRRVQWM